MANVGYAQGSREKICAGRRVFHPRRSGQGVRVANPAVDPDELEGDAEDEEEEEDEEVDDSGARRTSARKYLRPEDPISSRPTFLVRCVWCIMPHIQLFCASGPPPYFILQRETHSASGGYPRYPHFAPRDQSSFLLYLSAFARRISATSGLPAYFVSHQFFSLIFFVIPIYFLF